MKAGAERRRRSTTCRALRFMASVGEPLNPEAVVWGQEAFGLPVHDNWWQTETGGDHDRELPADGHPARLHGPAPARHRGRHRRRDETATGGRDGEVELITEPDDEGELALRPGWPSMFRGYLDEEERYRRCFAGGWYLTGDLAQARRDGYFWFVGRGDDVIKSAGHLIGPFEVESALMEHPAVAEAGVIGMPDPVAGEVVKAFVALKPGLRAIRRAPAATSSASPASGSGAAVAPREIDFTDDAAQDPQRQDPAPPAEGPRARAARRRHCRRSKPHRRVPHERRLSSASARGPAARGLRPCPAPAAPDAARAPARGTAAWSSTARRRSAGSCTSTSARKRSPRVSCSALRAGGRGRGHLPRARPRPAARRVRGGAIMAEMYGKPRAAAAAAAAPCTSSTPPPASTAATPSSAGGLPLAVGLALADKMRGRPG